MYTSEDSDNFWSHENCGCGYCDSDKDSFYGEEDLYDDPYEVVMYDLDSVDDDLFTLIDMLGDTAKSWYAKRRLNALSAAGPLSALVADIIIDSLGRRWNPLLHPRDRFGRFIKTGGFFRWLSRGKWLRAQVVRIDSDGIIHARSEGNDGIPDGTPLKFNPKQASKLIGTSAEKADLTFVAPDLDADIPGFPEASPTQRRIYNALQWGDMPAEDLDVYRSHGDLTPTDFAGEILGLEERGLIEVDRNTDKRRVRRVDDADLGVVNVSDEELDDVPDDEAPDFDDSPALTRQQRELLDHIADLDRGEGDGVTFDELTDSDRDDIQALVDAGALVDDDGRLHLVNPEDEGEAPGTSEAPRERDITEEIFDAANARFDDIDQQEAFQYYAEELARPGDANNIDRPEGLRPAQYRAAEQAAQAWWEERNAPTPGEADQESVPEPESDAPEQPQNVINPDNDRMVVGIMDRYFPDQDEWLESEEGIEYARAVKMLFEAEDFDDAGDTDRARLRRQDAERILTRLGYEEDIEDWPEAVREWRNDERDLADTPDATPEPEQALETPEPSEVVPEGAPEQDVPEASPAEEVGVWDQFAERIQSEGEADTFSARLEQERRIADELGIDVNDEDGQWTWNAFASEVGDRQAELIFNDTNGSIGEALAVDIDEYNRRVADEDAGGDVTPAPQDVTPEPEAEVVPEDVPGQDVPEASPAEEVVEPEVVDQEPSQRPAGDVSDPYYWEQVFADWEQENNGAISIVGTHFPSEEAPDATRASELPLLEQIRNREPFPIERFPELTTDPRGLVDRNGERVEIGKWYKANRGGEGDLGVAVGFYDQDKFPGWVLIRMPDDKYKAVHVVGRGREAGMNNVRSEFIEGEIEVWRAQRQAEEGRRVAELAQLDRLNVMEDGNPAEVGMAVEYLGRGGRFDPNKPAFVARLSMRKKMQQKRIGGKKVNLPVLDDNNEQVYEAYAHIVQPGAVEDRDLIVVAVSRLRRKQPTPTPTPDLTPAPDSNLTPGLDGADLPDRQWEFEPNDAVFERLKSLGEVDMIDFNNAYANPGAVPGQIFELVEEGRVEIVPDPDGGRPRLRAVTAPEGGNVVDDATSLPNGARDALEGDLLNIIDNVGTDGVPAADLIDLDEDDAAERMLALRELVDRRVLIREEGPDGKPVYKRLPTQSRTPTPMSSEEAIDALRNGEDPLLIANDSLTAALREAGFRFIPNGEAAAAGAISPNQWVIAPRNGDFPLKLRHHGVEPGKVYMVKRSASGKIKNDVMNELMASAISEDLRNRLGRESPGLLYHPKVGIADAPRGLGYSAGGAIIMDHAAYGYSENHRFYSGAKLRDSELRLGNATPSIIQLGLYDYLINNTKDRHKHNQMYVQDPDTGDFNAVIIDNGYAFGSGDSGVNSFSQYAEIWRPKDLLRRADRDDRAAIEKAVQDFVASYGQMDVESVMRHIRAAYPGITDEQYEYAREWVETASRRVEEIALDIDGVVDTIMGL